MWIIRSAGSPADFHPSFAATQSSGTVMRANRCCISGSMYRKRKIENESKCVTCDTNRFWNFGLEVGHVCHELLPQEDHRSQRESKQFINTNSVDQVNDQLTFGSNSNFICGHFAVMKPVVNQTVSFFLKEIFCRKWIVQSSWHLKFPRTILRTPKIIHRWRYFVSTNPSQAPKYIFFFGTKFFFLIFAIIRLEKRTSYVW